MKERQRWRPEEDALLRAYVKKYGAREWSLISQRMNKIINRDAKSCHERWKNYLKPGIKRGALSEDEQRLVISLQAKYGNKWKKIAAELPGRTAKRLGKWWEVFKEKQEKKNIYPTATDFANLTGEGKYDQILETYAEKYMQNRTQFIAPASYSLPAIPITMPPPAPSPLSLNLPSIPRPNFFHMNPSLSTPSTSSAVGATSSRPPWLPNVSGSGSKSVNSSYTSSESASLSSSSPSVTLSLSPSLSNQVISNATPKSTPNETPESIVREKSYSPTLVHNLSTNRDGVSVAESSIIMHQVSTFFQHCKELEDRQQSWFTHKKEASWRLKRLTEQLEAEKARKRREKIEEIESKVWALREEEKLYLDRLERDYREQIARLHKDEELKEARMMEMWSTKHLQLTKFFDQMVRRPSCKPYESSLN